MGIFRVITVSLFILSSWILWDMMSSNGYKKSSQKETRMPDKEIAENLRYFFQERYVGLECLGESAKFSVIKDNEDHVRVEPKIAFVPFMAQVKIDNVVKRIVGTTKVFSSTSSHKLIISFTKIGFQIFLKEWHFVKKGENTESYCQEKGLLRVKKMRPYSYFAPIDKLTMNSTRLHNEKDILNKRCDDGDIPSCQTIQKWEKAKSDYHTKFINKKEKKARKTKFYKDLEELFAQKYYKRLCDYNATSSACEELQ